MLRATMLILVTGAAGFIGSHLSERLRARGDEVIGFDNFDPFYPRAAKELNLAPLRAGPRFTFVEGDIRDAAALDARVRRTPPGGGRPPGGAGRRAPVTGRPRALRATSTSPARSA